MKYGYIEKINVMKKIQFSLLTMLFVGLLISCGSDNKGTVIESKDGKVSVDNLQEAGEQMEKAVIDAEKRRAERIKRGDTLAMNYKDLQAFLPEISGYTKKGKAGGETISMPGLGSFSTAEQEYEQGEKEIEIQLMDYNQSAMGYTTATAMFGMNIQVENDQEKSGTFDTGIDGVRGYEQVSKTDQRVELMYAIADRFFLTIKSTGSNDADALKKIAQSMKLSELAGK
jgi:hypothetical protein